MGKVAAAMVWRRAVTSPVAMRMGPALRGGVAEGLVVSCSARHASVTSSADRALSDEHQPQLLRNDVAQAEDSDLMKAAASRHADYIGAPSISTILATAEAERAELRNQVGALSQQCSALSRQVETLSKLLEREGYAGIRDLKNHPEWQEQSGCRREFRPTIEMVRDQPTHVSQIDNDTLFKLGIQGLHTAHKERLLREIMQVDNVNWEEAHKRLYEMDMYNEKFYWFQSMPYRVGVGGAIIFAVTSGLMVFWKPLAEAYGTKVAGEELPEGVKDIDELTTNQVGTWTWSWMEPMIGTASFMLLCCQFARAQAWKLNMRPYTESMQRWRANRLAKEFPQYDTAMVRAWAKHLPMVKWNFFPTYRRALGYKAI